jgi:hypothetical protein
LGEGKALLAEAREEQLRLIGVDPENFEYRYDRKRTEAALNR